MLSFKVRDTVIELDCKSLCVISKSETEKRALADSVCGISLSTDKSAHSGKVILLPKGVPLPDFMTVRQYFDLAMEIDGCGVMNDFAADTVSDMLDEKISALSKAERLTAGILSVIAPSPDAVFIEEPDLGLTPEEAENVFSVMLSNDHPCTVIYTAVTASAMRRADKILALENGRVMFYVTPNELDDVINGNGTLTARIMGSKEKIEETFSSLGAEIQPDERKGVYAVTLDGSVTPDDVKRLIRGKGVTLIDTRKSNEKIAKLVKELESAERIENDKRASESSAPKKIDISLTAFSRFSGENDFDDDDAAEENGEDTSDITRFFSDRDDDDEDGEDDGESTLFSSHDR